MILNQDTKCYYLILKFYIRIHYPGTIPRAGSPEISSSFPACPLGYLHRHESFHQEGFVEEAEKPLRMMKDGFHVVLLRLSLYQENPATFNTNKGGKRICRFFLHNTLELRKKNITKAKNNWTTWIQAMRWQFYSFFGLSLWFNRTKITFTSSKTRHQAQSEQINTYHATLSADGYTIDFPYMEAAEAAAWSLAWCLLKLSLEPPAEERVSDPWPPELEVPCWEPWCNPRCPAAVVDVPFSGGTTSALQVGHVCCRSNHDRRQCTWKRCPHISFFAVVISSRHMIHVASLLHNIRFFPNLTRPE